MGEITVENNQKVIIRYEPVLLYLYLFGILTVLMFFGIFEGEPVESFLVVLLLESFLLLAHIVLRDRITAEINKEGINIIGERFIKWEEIEKWSYEPTNRIKSNKLKIELRNGESYEIRGFRYLKVTRALKQYIPEKQSRFSLIWDYFVRGLFIISIILIFTIKYWS